MSAPGPVNQTWWLLAAGGGWEGGISEEEEIVGDSERGLVLGERRLRRRKRRPASRSGHYATARCKTRCFCYIDGMGNRHSVIFRDGTLANEPPARCRGWHYLERFNDNPSMRRTSPHILDLLRKIPENTGIPTAQHTRSNSAIRILKPTIRTEWNPTTQRFTKPGAGGLRITKQTAVIRDPLGDPKPDPLVSKKLEN
ncbi:hypothetical protein M569_17002 [Genlisea aurea]|uniref:Uncharacterized protein n=1 Tax=Genlisea aurea TaxID=192259 RepID=S8BT78_9LAMI|nr:hypothetical protein M569_17002 [Genlisea aurea]